MEQTIINGFRVMILKGFDGTQLFINDGRGNQIYAHRVSGDPMERAREVISRFAPAAVEERQAEKGEMICLGEQKAEFVKALARAANFEFEVFPDWDRDSFVVVNKTSKTEYRVRLVTVKGKSFASCGCKDYFHRTRVCKHIGEVLTFMALGVFAKI